MGKTFSTGLLTNGVFQDASNNIGIGAAPSGTYKLEVTGTAKVSSTLLLGGALSGTSATFSGNVQVGGAAIGGNSSSFYNTAAETSVTIKQTSGATILALGLWNNSTTGDSRFLRFFTEATATYRGSIQYDRPGDRLAIYGGGSGLFFDGAATFSSSVTATSESSLFKEGFIVKATTTSGGGSQPAYTYYTAAGSKRWSHFLNVGDDKFFIANASNTEVFTIQQNGNVGINKIDPATTLNVVGGTSGSSGRLRLTHSTSGSQIDLYVGVSDGTGIIVNNNPLFFEVNGTERMRIRSDGEVLMHSTTFNSANDGQLFGTGGDTYFTVAGATVLYLNRRTTNGVIIDFRFNNTSVGSISTNSNSLPSDRNFKKNITDISIGLDLVTKLKPVHYRHKFDEDNEPLSNGIIAQELEEALLECGIEKNSLLMLQYKPNEKEGESQYWVDYTKMIPVLVKAIQELSAQNQDLKSRLDKAGL